MKTSGGIRILLVDDHPFIREGLISSLSSHDDLVVCGEAASVDQALRTVPKSKPDIVVTDLTLEGKSGMELIKELKCHYPNLPVIVLSMHDEKIHGPRALHAGARGYVMKREKVARLAQAIRKVHAGRLHISEDLSEFLLSGMPSNKNGNMVKFDLSCLTPREFEIFRLLGQGKAPKEIARDLSISIKTINNHRSNIREKLGFASFNDLLIYAVRWCETEE